MRHASMLESVGVPFFYSYGFFPYLKKQLLDIKKGENMATMKTAQLGRKPINWVKCVTILSFLLPSFIGFVVFVLAPMIWSVFLSFTNYRGGPNYKFIGLENYVNAFSDPNFWSYLWITAKYMVITVVFQIVLGLAFAILLQHQFKGCGFFRGVYYLPNILASVAVGIAFMTMFRPVSEAAGAPNGGIINATLISLGLEPSQFLAGQETALGVIIIVSIWQNFGYYMVLFIGSLQNVNTSLYEAADMDGAGWWKKFTTVTIPGISPILFYGITIAIIRGFQMFDYVYVMTGGQFGGGPAGSTNVLAFDIYKMFTMSRYGYASAEAVILMVIILALTVIQQEGQKKWVVYDVV